MSVHDLFDTMFLLPFLNGLLLAVLLPLLGAWIRLCEEWLGVFAYLGSFVAAVQVDPPFGPVLVAVLLLMAPLRALARG